MFSAYFDNAATSFPKPPEFYTETMRLFQEFGVNGTRGHHQLAEEMLKNENLLRGNLATIFGVTPDKIVLTASATLAANQIIQGLDYSSIKTVYISPFEHNATYRTIWAMQQRHGFNLKFLPFERFCWDEPKTGFLFANASPDVVICTHASNVFGNILPVKKIFSAAKKYDAITILDTAQTAGAIPTEAADLKADFIIWAGHKGLYGPPGIGGFAINSPYCLNPVVFGGTGVFSEEKSMPKSLPEKFEIGSMNSLNILGLMVSTDWLLKNRVDVIKKKHEMTQALFKVLNKFSDICSIVSDEQTSNIGVISVVPRTMSPAEMDSYLAQAGICVRSGLHCAPLAHDHMNTTPEGAVRFSAGCFNTYQEICLLKTILEDLH